MLYNWENAMTLHKQSYIDDDGKEVVREVAPLVIPAHDDVHEHEQHQANLVTSDKPDRCMRRLELPRPMLLKEMPEHLIDLDFGEASAKTRNKVARLSADKMDHFETMMQAVKKHINQGELPDGVDKTALYASALVKIAHDVCSSTESSACA